MWLILAVALSAGYKCEGIAMDGKPYVLPLMIETQGENYIFYWVGNTVGLGIKRDDYVSIALLNPETRGMGVAYYKASKGKLEGTWSPGDGKTYKEVCIEAEVKLFPGHPQSAPKSPVKEKGLRASK